MSTSRRIFINTRYTSRPITGVERYAGELARRLGDDLIPLEPRRPLDGWRAHVWEQCVLPQRVPARGLLWSPANTGPLLARNQVLTLHDLAPLDHPAWYAPAFRLWYLLLLPRLAQRVRHIITGSAFSRGRIMARLGLPEERVSIVPYGVGAAFQPRGAAETMALRARYGLPEAFALFVGSVQPRKNLGGLLGALAGLPGVPLVVAGGAGGQFAPTGRLGQREGVVWLGRFPDTDLPALYSAARLFVMPSLYEGGGLTVLEAMACGCPVIAAANTALPEYAGDCGMLADPRDAESLRKAIQTLWADGELRADLRCRGLARAAGFTWERAAQGVRQILVHFAA